MAIGVEHQVSPGVAWLAVLPSPLRVFVRAHPVRPRSPPPGKDEPKPRRVAWLFAHRSVHPVAAFQQPMINLDKRQGLRD